jgi:hypothetical protein
VQDQLFPVLEVDFKKFILVRKRTPELHLQSIRLLLVACFSLIIPSVPYSCDHSSMSVWTYRCVNGLENVLRYNTPHSMVFLSYPQYYRKCPNLQDLILLKSTSTSPSRLVPTDIRFPNDKPVSKMTILWVYMRTLSADSAQYGPHADSGSGISWGIDRESRSNAVCISPRMAIMRNIDQ